MADVNVDGVPEPIECETTRVLEMPRGSTPPLPRRRARTTPLQVEWFEAAIKGCR